MKMVRNLFLSFILISLSVFAAGIPEVKNTDSFQMGRGANGDDKTFTFDIGDGASNPQLLINDTNKLFEFNLGLDVTGAGTFSGNVSGVNGTFTGPVSGTTATFTGLTYGDATTGDNKQTIDIGLGASNPQIGWSNTLQALVFDNGTGEKKLGTGGGGGGLGEPLLANPSFEDVGSPILNWTQSGGTFTQEDHVNNTETNLKFARMVTAGAAEYFESDLITIPSYMGPGCETDFIYNQGGNVFEFQVLDASNDIKAVRSLGDVNVFSESTSLPFNCADGEQFKLRIISTGAGTIDVDNAYLGPARLTPLSNPYMSIVLGRDNANSSLTAGVTDIDWTEVIDTQGAWDGQIYTVQKTGSIIKVDGSIVLDASSANTVDMFVNGINNRRVGELNDQNEVLISATISDLVAGDQISFRYTTGGGLTPSSNLHHISIVETNKVAATAHYPGQSSFFLDVSIGGANISTAVTGGTPDEVTNSGLDMVINPDSASARIPCSGTNPPTGLTCSSGSESVGVNFNSDEASRYKACINFSAKTTGATIGAGRWVETGNSDNTPIQIGKASYHLSKESSDGSSSLAVNGCSYFNLGVGEKTLRFMTETNNVVTIFGDRNASGFERDINITVERVGHNTSKPIVIDDSNVVKTPGVTEPKSFSFRTSTTGVVSNEKGDSVNGNCNNPSSGRYECSLNLGFIDSDPNCNFSLQGLGNQGFVNWITMSSTIIEFQTYGSGGGVSPRAVSITCGE